MRYFKSFLVLATLFIGTSVMAQDIHFSQFYNSPLNLNPALTGVMNCNTRVVGNYRNQWSQVLRGDAYNTYSVSYDQKIAVGRSDYFGIGGTFWGDRAGELSFGSTQARMSFSYSKKMGGYRKKAHYLVFGADAGIQQRRIDLTNARWPSQHDGNGGFDRNIPAPFDNSSGEINPDFLHADVSAGLVWFSVLDEKNNFYVGAAIHHLNQPNVTFFTADTFMGTPGDNVEALTSRVTIHAGGEFAILSLIHI